MENHEIQRISIEIQKINVSHTSATLHETVVFLGQMHGPEPWDHQNLEISRIPLNLVKFHDFNEIMLNFSYFS